MPRLEDVAILMQQNSDNITFLYPAGGTDWDALRHMAPLEPFSEGAVAFLSALSATLMRDPLTRTMPDVATFAFFCRKANLERLRKAHTLTGELRMGRGVLFHVAPSNVPVNFAYSLVAGILSGNANVVRVPSKDFPQVALIVKSIGAVLSCETDPQGFRNRIALVRYERGGRATDTLSALCDVRIVWGGDATIADIRRSPIPARAFDVTFADRYSFCAIDATAYLATDQAEKIAEAFYNDTYLFDQNACSAPHLVVWRGTAEVVECAKTKFWKALYDYTSRKYELAEVLAVDKLTAFYSQAVGMEIRREAGVDNLIWRVEASALPENIDTYRCKAGYFTEYRVDNLGEIAHIINRKYQTLAYYGFGQEELEEFVTAARPSGIDRIVPIGKTTDFALVWDGYDLIKTLSRIISIL